MQSDRRRGLSEKAQAADEETEHRLYRAFYHRSPSPHLPNHWWGKRSKKSLFVSYQQEIAFAKIVLGGGGVRAWKGWHSYMTIISLVPRHVACLWSGARVGQEGRRWAGEGWEPWVGSTTWASLMGRQPSAWYVGMRAATAQADVRDFKSAWADDCETRAATLLTSAHSVPLSLTIYLSSSQWGGANRA